MNTNIGNDVSDLKVNGSVYNGIQTNDTHFYGMARRATPDADCPTFTHKYVDTGGKRDVVCRIVGAGLFPALLVGDTGTGKTECLKDIAREIGIGMIRVNHNIRSEPEDILGAWIVDEEGKPTLSRGPLIEALEDGKFYYADELNYAKPGVLMAYQPVLENYGTITLTIGKHKKVVRRHPDFRFVAAMNPLSYAGSNEMSAATFNRFIAVQFDYAPAVAELAILREVYPALNEEAGKILVNMANANRSTRNNDYTVQYIISTRDLIKACHLKLDLGLSWQTSLELVVLNAAREINSEQLPELQTLVMSYAGKL